MKDLIWVVMVILIYVRNAKGGAKNMFKKIIMFAVLLVLILPITSAAIENLGTFKEKECIVLKQIAQNSTYCNISSVLAPNSSQLLGESIMTKLNTNYNKSNFCSTTALGTYIVNGHCDLNGVDTVWSYTFVITPTGESDNLGMYIIISIIIIGTLLFGVLTRNIPMTMLGGLFCMAFGTYTVLYGFDSFRNLGTQIVSMAIISGGAYWGIKAGLESIDAI